MPKTALELTPQEWRMYNPAKSLKARRNKEKLVDEKRKQQAWQVAREAAKLLREKFNAKKVIVFGSLVHGCWFNKWSDIDLAVYEIPPEQFYRSVAALIDLSTDFTINLVDINSCQPTIETVIQQDGIEL